jgi:hypothetical protein
MTAIPDDETGEALRLIEENGSDLSQPMEMEFFVAVPSEEAGREIARRAEALGFDALVEYDEEDAAWTCYCVKTMIPAYEAVVGVEKQLGALAEPFGGYADGFGSFGNAPE